MITKFFEPKALAATRFERAYMKCDLCHRETGEFLQISIDLSRNRIIALRLCPICERDLTVDLYPRKRKPRRTQ
jgi:hypothetical protein